MNRPTKITFAEMRDMGVRGAVSGAALGMLIRPGSDRGEVNRRKDWPDRIFRSERTP